MADRRYYTPSDSAEIAEAVFTWLSTVNKSYGRQVTPDLIEPYNAWAQWAGAPACPSVNLMTRKLTSFEVPIYRTAQGRGFDVPASAIELMPPLSPILVGVRRLMKNAEPGWWALDSIVQVVEAAGFDFTVSKNYLGTIMLKIAKDRRGSGGDVEFLV